MIEKTKRLSTYLSKIRRTLHQYPELSFQEFNTADYISSELAKIKGIEVRTGKKDTGLETGVIGVIENGSGPSIAIRADMDALPVLEKNNHSYVSKNHGVMHACGHDAHTTILLGVAKVLAEESMTGQLNGKIKLIFQPAEEDTDDYGYTGSPYMIQAGVLDDVDAVLALHVDPEKPVGEVKLNPGSSMASVDTFEGKIFGSGGHAAYPHLGRDPIWMLGLVLHAIQGIVSRNISPLAPSVITVTHVNTIPSFNVIPNEVMIQGTIRSYDIKVRQKLEQELRQTFQMIEAQGGQYDLNIHNGEPALKNDPIVTKWIKQTICEMLPDFTIHREPYGLGGEDFGYMTEAVPGAMFFLGAGILGRTNSGLHMPHFDIDEQALIYGSAILAETAAKYLRGEVSL